MGVGGSREFRGLDEMRTNDTLYVVVREERKRMLAGS